MRFIMRLIGGFAAVFVFNFILEVTGSNPEDFGRMYWVYMFSFITLGDYIGQGAHSKDG